jgi:signal transduction histidine kinase
LKLKLTLLLVFIIALPFGLLTWVGFKTAEDQEALEAVRFSELLDARLALLTNSVQSVLDKHETALAGRTRLERLTPGALRELASNERLVRHLFVLDARGELAFPSDNEEASLEERAFLKRIDRILKSGERFTRPSDTGQSTRFGWYVWYFEEGVNLIFWQKLDSEETIGAELSRIALLSDIVGQMNEELPKGVSADEARVSLRDVSGREIYGFGKYVPKSDEAPRVRRSLEEPLGSLELGFYISPEGVAGNLGSGGALNLFVGLAAMLLVIGLGTVYYLRETGREIREAIKRVTFVNQVSHELKTPLTNIRMYAELLEQDLDEEETEARKHLDVIVRESQRLTRLIANVLTFGRGQRKQLELHRTPGVVDDVIRKILLQFEPSLGAKHIEIEQRLDAPQTVEVDADALEQILGNLVGNVEKYAAGGKRLIVSSSRTEDETSIVVEDRGGGIPKRVRKRIFEPFFRVSGSLTDGVSGTGIGLAISRDLARLHGGDVVLEESESGARFNVVLKTPRVTFKNGLETQIP